MAEATKDAFVYQLILNPTTKISAKQSDPRKFARLIRAQLEDLMTKISGADNNITIDGKVFDKTTAAGALIINNKLSELESMNTENNSFLSFIKRTEDSLRQMLG